ncbi:hypothetical protein FRC07_007335 [Ceratobasidium sp. 392]|nr:hypothetical protein FRC07_007335 [Ceratobasidium sp. 392]
MVSVLHPVDPLAHKPRTHSFHCVPLPRRRTTPTTRDLVVSHSWRQNAIERAAIRKITAQLTPSVSPLPKLSAFQSLPTILSVGSEIHPSALLVHSPAPGISIQAEGIQPEGIPGTPATPLESQGYYPEPETQPESQPEPKANIFNTNTKSDVLLDLTIAALHRIYIDDYSETSSYHTEVQPLPSVTLQVPGLLKPRASVDYYEQSPPSISGSAVSSVNSTPCSRLATPNPFSPAIDPDIAYTHQAGDSGRFFPNGTGTASIVSAAAATKSVKRTQSVPMHTKLTPAPTLGDKNNLRWFLVELLRRSRSSASVVQLALHYLAQARTPVGNILDRRFKSGPRQGEEDGQGSEGNRGEDSPLLDPRRLLLAALMLSTKLLHDHAPNNRAWARVCGLSPVEVGACERALCQALDWNLANMFVGSRDEQPVVV